MYANHYKLTSIEKHQLLKRDKRGLTFTVVLSVVMFIQYLLLHENIFNNKRLLTPVKIKQIRFNDVLTDSINSNTRSMYSLYLSGAVVNTVKMQFYVFIFVVSQSCSVDVRPLLYVSQLVYLKYVIFIFIICTDSVYM